VRHKLPYTLYKRIIKDGTRVWYCSWYDCAGRRVQRSTGTTSKAEAAQLALGMVQTTVVEAPTLSDFARDFYKWDQCSWIKRQVAKGRGLSKSWAQARRAMVDNHILPAFGNTRLSAITRPMIERWLVDLPRSNQTRNHILYALKTILSEAEADRIIIRNPLDHAEPMGKQARRRDAFSVGELRRLFPVDHEQLTEVWGELKYATLFMVLATTGIRSGEARALQWRHVLPNGWLVVEKAVKQDGAIGAPKNGDSRVAAIPARTQALLSTWFENSHFKAPDDLVFFGDRADHPLNRRTFGDILRRAMSTAKVEVDGRFLSTHSFRHSYNTLLRRSLPADVLRALLGHHDERMTQHYDHPAIQDHIRLVEGSLGQVENAFGWLSAVSADAVRVSDRRPVLHQIGMCQPVQVGNAKKQPTEAGNADPRGRHG
jgi:integrase